MKIAAMILLIVAFIGCSRQAGEQQAQAAGADSGGTRIPNASTALGEEDPDEVLISVNGKVLTRGEALRQVHLRLGGPPPVDATAERIAMIQTQTLSKVIDEFVKRELLLTEADRLDIVATETEMAAAIESIRRRSPEGDTPRGILDHGPAGSDSLHNEVSIGIRIEKLLAAELTIEDPTPEEIDQFIMENRDKLTIPESVRARHILVKTVSGETPEARAGKRAVAEAFRQRLMEGEDFETLASAVSECPSAARGGDLGLFPRGKMVKAFEDAAFSQPIGDIGPVIETDFGFHILRVDDHLDKGAANRQQVEDVIRRRRRVLALADYTRQLQHKADIKHSPSVRPPAPAAVHRP